MDDKIFKNIDVYNFDVTDEQVFKFKTETLDKKLPNEYIVESFVGFFKVNKSKKEFRILKRKYYNYLDFLNYPKDEDIDNAIFITYKVAIKSGFKVFLESKYSN
jgi:hypothetical protein